MVSKIGQYLQEHMTGEVVSTADARRYFSTDGSIFSLTPALIVYPRNENDVRKVARFTWQLAERSRIIPITARGAGTDQGGAAIGNGIMMVFPAHMNRIVELDTKNGTVTAEPGANYGKVQQALLTHGRFLPPFPASLEYSTIGGAVANNACGEKTVKYGDTRNYVGNLRVVLANGEVIVTERLNKRELNKKLGLSTFEGEIYRSVDALLEECKATVELMERDVTKNAAGYELLDIRRSDDSFDLTPLFVGSQGTLGIITEVTLATEAYNAHTTLLLASFDNLQHLQQAVAELKRSTEVPSAIELVDGGLLGFVASINPNHLHGLVEEPYPKWMLLVEYDDNGRQQQKRAKRGMKILKQYATEVQQETDLEKQEHLWRIRSVSSLALTHADNLSRAVPILDDGTVPVAKLQAYIEGVYSMLERNHLQPAVWGHAGDGNLHAHPHLDLSQVGDRQKVFKLLDEYCKLVVELGGSISGEHGDGRLRAPYLKHMYGEEVYELMQKVKKIFDPYGVLNPGVKMSATLDDIKPLLRHEYGLNHLYDHLPRT